MELNKNTTASTPIPAGQFAAASMDAGLAAAPADTGYGNPAAASGGAGANPNAADTNSNGAAPGTPGYAYTEYTTSTSSPDTVLTLDDVSFSYGERPVLSHVSFSFDRGRIYAIVGRSGAGKTTLLSLMSGLTNPTDGRILRDGRDLTSYDKSLYRSSDIGVIFQSFNLLPKLTAVENVQLSMEIAQMNRGNKPNSAALLDGAYRCLEQVGLTRDEADRRVLKLSGGQQQRVAIARALSYDPACILADEPTGNLDEQTQAEIMSIFRSLAASGKCVIIVTHSSYVASKADVTVDLKSLNSMTK